MKRSEYELDGMEKSVQVKTSRTKRARRWFSAPGFAGTVLEGGAIVTDREKYWARQKEENNDRK